MLKYICAGVAIGIAASVAISPARSHPPFKHQYLQCEALKSGLLAWTYYGNQAEWDKQSPEEVKEAMEAIHRILRAAKKMGCVI